MLIILQVQRLHSRNGRKVLLYIHSPAKVLSLPTQNYIGFYLNSFWTKLDLDWTKIVQTVAISCRKQITIHRKIDLVQSAYGLACDGIVKFSTAGMGAQSQLYGWQFGAWKRIVMEKMRVKVCDKTSLTETHMATWIITFRDWQQISARDFSKTERFAVVLHYIIRWISFHATV
jgi:hypothetical protein